MFGRQNSDTSGSAEPRIGQNARKVTFRGNWRLTVVENQSPFQQRLTINGDYTALTLDGMVGTNRVIDSANWNLTLEHHDGSGWRQNLLTTLEPLEPGRWVIRTKDCRWGNGSIDAQPDDLILVAESVRDPAQTPLPSPGEVVGKAGQEPVAAGIIPEITVGHPAMTDDRQDYELVTRAISSSVVSASSSVDSVRSATNSASSSVNSAEPVHPVVKNEGLPPHRTNTAEADGVA
jgi:hypothetical protein